MEMPRIARITLYALLFAFPVQAAMAQQDSSPLTFQFTFCEGSQNGAQARGWITFDQNLMANPFLQSVELPDPLVLDLEVTVSKANAGNGTFGMSDFARIFWDSNGGTLNFATELVGQPTNGLPWGTVPSEGEAGDFNLFGLSAGAPTGQFFFLLGADEGDAEIMQLVSMVPGAESPGTAVCNIGQNQAIPTVGTWAKIIMVLLIAGLAGLAFRRQAA